MTSPLSRGPDGSSPSGPVGDAVAAALAHVALLVLAGIGSGLIGYLTGLASLVGYPALLAVGLPSVAANVMNTLGPLVQRCLPEQVVRWAVAVAGLGLALWLARA